MTKDTFRATTETRFTFTVKGEESQQISDGSP